MTYQIDKEYTSYDNAINSVIKALNDIELKELELNYYSTCNAELTGYMCNRPCNHTGPHIATGTDIVAMWTDSTHEVK